MRSPKLYLPGGLRGHRNDRCGSDEYRGVGQGPEPESTVQYGQSLFRMLPGRLDAFSSDIRKKSRCTERELNVCWNYHWLFPVQLSCPQVAWRSDHL